jgi:hypothetical protein
MESFDKKSDDEKKQFLGEYFFHYVCIKVERDLKKHYVEDV